MDRLNTSKGIINSDLFIREKPFAQNDTGQQNSFFGNPLLLITRFLKYTTSRGGVNNVEEG